MPSRERQRRRQRDPLTKRERQVLVREHLERAKAGDRDSAEILIDLIHDEDPDLSEDLGLALQGRATLDDVYPGTGSVVTRRGASLPVHLRGPNFTHTLQRIERWRFPKRRSPCMPNRKELRDLLRTAQHVHAWTDEDYDVKRVLRDLWAALRRACEVNTTPAHEEAMDLANDAIAGFGVETVDVPTRRGGTPSFQYVNTGDTYNPTLAYDMQSSRYRVTTYGDMIEDWERRWGRTDIDEDPDTWQ